MAMVIQEYAGSDLSFDIVEDENLANNFSLTEADQADPIDPNSVLVDVEGIHAYPHATRNYTRYMPKCLKNSVPSWTTPYRRPLIKHHNEKNGQIIGRVMNAEYKTRDTFSGTPALLFTVTVPGEEAKADVKNGTESTVSIGVLAHDVRCSICGQQLAGGEMCEHERGVTYDGETCYWDIHSMEAKELSYVIVPSDIYAKNRKIYSAAKSGDKTQITESLDDSIRKGEQQMAEDNQKELAEAKATISTLEAKVSELTEAQKTAETTVAKLTEANKELEGQVATLTEAKAQLESTATEEKALREGLETALEDAKIARKESLVEAVQALRKAAGKSTADAEQIKNRSEESLSDTILDLKEELAVVEAKTPEAAAPGSVTSPALAEEDDAQVGSTTIEENNNEEKIDLEAGYRALFSDMFSRHK